MLLLGMWAGNWPHHVLLAASSASGTWACKAAQTWPAACKGFSSNAFFTASEIITTISFLCDSVLLEALISQAYCWAKWCTHALLNEMSAGMCLSPACPWRVQAWGKRASPAKGLSWLSADLPLSRVGALVLLRWIPPPEENLCWKHQKQPWAVLDLD